MGDGAVLVVGRDGINVASPGQDNYVRVRGLGGAQPAHLQCIAERGAHGCSTLDCYRVGRTCSDGLRRVRVPAGQCQKFGASGVARCRRKPPAFTRFIDGAGGASVGDDALRPYLTPRAGLGCLLPTAVSPEPGEPLDLSRCHRDRRRMITEMDAVSSTPDEGYLRAEVWSGVCTHAPMVGAGACGRKGAIHRLDALRDPAHRCLAAELHDCVGEHRSAGHGVVDRYVLIGCMGKGGVTWSVLDRGYSG